MPLIAPIVAYQGSWDNLFCLTWSFVWRTGSSSTSSSCWGGLRRAVGGSVWQHFACGEGKGSAWRDGMQEGEEVPRLGMAGRQLRRSLARWRVGADAAAVAAAALRSCWGSHLLTSPSTGCGWYLAWLSSCFQRRESYQEGRNRRPGGSCRPVGGHFSRLKVVSQVWLTRGWYADSEDRADSGHCS